MNLPISYVSVEKSEEMLRGVTFVHVQGEYAAVLAGDSSDQSLQLYRVVNPYGGVASQESSYGENNRRDTV